MSGTAKERTGWRDEEISRRHRLWGVACPAVDLDFVLLEYHHGKPCAIVEYKHVRAREIDPTKSNYRALVALANGYRNGAIPCFVARYNPVDWSFVVTPLNQVAADHYRESAGLWMTEQQFVRSLLFLRKSVLAKEDEAAIAALNGHLASEMLF